MKLRKIICSALAVALISTSLTGCGTETKVKKNSFDSKIASTVITDTFIAENDNFKLELNELTMGIMLTDKITGNVYGTNPVDEGGIQYDEFGMPIKRHPQLESVLLLEYLDVEKNTTVKEISYNAAVKGGRTVLEKNENGVTISYYFDDAQIMIPITYTLREDGVKLTVDP